MATTDTNNLATVSGADLLIRALQINGLDTMFALPGGQLDDLFDAVQRTQARQRDSFHLVRSRHEQGAAYMAFGAARSTGKPAVFAVVPGPGLMNAMGALSTAWAANAKVLSLSGQIPSHGIGSGRGYLHEMPDQLATMRTLLKYAERITAPHAANAMLNAALEAMHSGRPGPVHLEMPQDMMAARSADVAAYKAAPLTAPVAADAAIAAAIDLLRSAKKPLIYVGSGAIEAAEQVQALAEMIEAPVVSFRSGRGVVDDDDYHAQVFPAGRRLWAHADVVFAIGTRLKYPQLYWGVDDKLKIIRLDIDAKEFARYAAPAVALQGDARATLQVLLPALRSAQKTQPASRKEELMQLKRGLQQEMLAKLAPQMAYLSAIREVLPRDGIFCDEITQIGFASWLGLPIHRLRGHINCGFQGTLGYGYATALGVKVAHPNTPVVSVSGDGGFLFTSNEIATAVEYGINLVTVVFNDNCYANVYRQQKEWYDGRFIASKLHNPDFVSYARSFGCNAEKVDNPEQLKPALERAFAAQGPTLIEAYQAPNLPTPWQFILEAPVRGPDAAP